MGDTLRISRSCLDALIGRAAACRDEICGLLIEGGSAIACANVHATPATHFEIDARALIAAHRSERQGGARLIGCYHSHPTGSVLPSATDAEAALDEGWIWLIVGGGTAAAWRTVRDGAVHGRFDPVELVVT